MFIEVLGIFVRIMKIRLYFILFYFYFYFSFVFFIFGTRIRVGFDVTVMVT